MKDAELKSIAEQTAAKTRGGKSASIEIHNTATKEEISQIIDNSYKWFNYPEVKTEDEVAKRLNMFFTECSKTGEIPTVEKMCLALGTYRHKVWDWENGRGGVTSAWTNMIKKAKQILASMDAELVSQGKIPQVTYIFRSKNFYGMTDQQEIVVTPNNPLGEGYSENDLKTYAAELPDDTSDE